MFRGSIIFCRSVLFVLSLSFCIFITPQIGFTDEPAAVGRHEMDKLLQSKWIGLKNALRNGDIPTALTYIAKRNRSEYEKVFRSLYVPLAQIDKVLTDITLVRMGAAYAEYEMLRTGPQGEIAYMVRFGIDEDGVWRISDF